MAEVTDALCQVLLPGQDRPRRPEPGSGAALGAKPLKQERTAKVGIKAKRKKAGWDYPYLLKVLSP